MIMEEIMKHETTIVSSNIPLDISQLTLTTDYRRDWLWKVDAITPTTADAPNIAEPLFSG